MSNTGIITKVSQQDFESTYKTLRQTIHGNPNLKIILELDHQANAASVGLTLPPIKIILFGNPKLGTPLMSSAITTGLDLPQKILVTQDEEGITSISYNDPMYLKERHTILGQEAVLQKVSTALDKITTKATLSTSN